MGSAIPSGPITVLVVDDDRSLRSVLARALVAEGFVVWEAASGEGALELLRGRPGEVSLALVDVHMPGMGGLAAVRALRDQQPTLHCGLMGGLISPGDAEACGADFVVEKPFSPTQLARQLRRLASPPDHPAAGELPPNGVQQFPQGPQSLCRG